MPLVMLGQETGDSGESLPSEPQVKMFSYGKEICFLLAVLFTSYAALHNPLPRVSRTPAPVRFFRQNSVVDDFFMGNLNTVLERISQSDIAFVMYYAPWDAESQKVRWHFEAAARYYHDQVYFAAINCWQPGSECRQQYSKIPTFPVLMLYPQQHSGLQFRGIREVSHILRFLRAALSPLIRMYEPFDLLRTLANHDAVVVGFFDLDSDQDEEYTAYHDAAVSFLEQDYMQDVAFAAVTNEELARQFNVDETPNIRLYLWNESLTFAPSSTWSADSLVSWVAQNLHQVAVWVQPPGIKSLTLSAYVQEGPVLLLFTPRNPLLDHVYYYDLLREVALEFFNCSKNAWSNTLAEIIWRNRNEISMKYHNLLGECSHWRKLRGQGGGVAPVLTMQREPPSHTLHWTNSSVCETEPLESLIPPRDGFDHGYCGLLNYESDILRSNPDSSHFGDKSWSSYLGLGRKMTQKTVDIKLRKQLRAGMCDGRTSMLTGDADVLWAEELCRKRKDEVCRELRHARLLDKPHYPETENETEVSDSIDQNLSLHGMACQANRTLSFLALDSLQLHQFAEGLGVDVLQRKDKTAVLIINPQQESHYLLKGEVNKASVVNFIKAYISNALPRWQRTTSTKPRSVGFSLGPTQTLHLNRYAEKSAPQCSENFICVPEVSSSTFKSEILESEKNVVVMFHSPYCVFCSGVSHVFLTVAHTLNSVSTLKFTRIDGDNNDLPWEFTMHRFPSILFFPANDKANSRIFPSHMQITVPNLAQFVLSNLSPEERILALLVICSQGSGRRPLSYEDQTSTQKCLSQVKVEATQAASFLLARYHTLVALAARHDGQAGFTLKSYIKRLTIRVRFLRSSMSLLSPTSSFASGLLARVQEAFVQWQESLAQVDSKPTVVRDEL